MQNDEVGVAALLLSDCYVVPDGVVIFEQAFQALTKAAFAGGHVPDASEAGNYFCHCPIVRQLRVVLRFFFLMQPEAAVCAQL